MGSDARSTIIYGFNLSPEIIEDKGIDSEHAWAWEKHVTSDLIAPDSYTVAYRLRTPAQGIEVASWCAAKQQRTAASARINAWGYLDAPQYAIGVRLVHGNWDAPVEIEADNFGRVLLGPPDMDTRVAELCAWLGIDPQPCKLLLLSSYG